MIQVFFRWRCDPYCRQPGTVPACDAIHTPQGDNPHIPSTIPKHPRGWHDSLWKPVVEKVSVPRAMLLKPQCGQESPGDFARMQTQGGWRRAWGLAFPLRSQVMPRPRLERSEEEETTLDLGGKHFTEKKEHKEDREEQMDVKLMTPRRPRQWGHRHWGGPSSKQCPACISGLQPAAAAPAAAPATGRVTLTTPYWGWVCQTLVEFISFGKSSSFPFDKYCQGWNMWC